MPSYPDSKVTDGNQMLIKYKQTGDKNLRNEIVIYYGNLIKYAAISTRNMYLKYAEPEDIVNEATLALMSAIESFDFTREVKFETYASMKMRGAIIDYIRSQDIIPRTVRHFAKDLDFAFSQLYTKLNREPSTDEIAEFMNIPKDKLVKNMAAASCAATMSFEELLFEGDFDIGSKDENGIWETERKLFIEERNKVLAKSIDELKDQQRKVISLYYFNKLKFSEIAKVLGVSESRICQIHSKAVLKLKYIMEEYNNI